MLYRGRLLRSVVEFVVTISHTGIPEITGGSAAGQLHHASTSEMSSGASRVAAATATWYPQHPHQGSGYLSSPASRPPPAPYMNGPTPTMYQHPGYPSHMGRMGYLPPKLNTNASPYAQYAVQYYHHQNMQALYRSQMVQPDWRSVANPYGKCLIWDCIRSTVMMFRFHSIAVHFLLRGVVRLRSQKDCRYGRAR